MSSAYFDRPVLTGRYVRLEPLTLQHAEGLLEAGKDPEVWTWLNNGQPTDLAAMRAYVTRLLTMHEAGTLTPWARIDIRTGEPAGVTTYHDLTPKDRALHIGSTWIGGRWHRTGLNTEAKLMLLERAFDTLGVLRVGWMTHHNNLRSQRAIERLGAQREGVLRNHKTMPDASQRNTVVYSMIDSEWPAARDALRARLRQSAISPGRWGGR
ncbi:N-acetyltransferase [Planotetraspora silvatica]|uniref:N-acetyltransferase n=1 Tax=Planotetraspora silvatica TaxID=234614 RepID=A0A8J3UUH3_9ACTN|nr:GNAT family N-acetyltransferase [Planotetraspora silvatica]GII50052.1 N-acetyltransferase [Planotetraspora silvatica]